MPTPSQPTAAQARAQDRDFIARCSLSARRGQLPLSWPVSPDTPPSPKRVYRSHYVYRGWEELEDTAQREHFSDFDILLRLVDFSALRDELAHRLGWTSAKGHVPFDPVSMFLLIGWRIVNGWSRAELLRKLHDPRYADYARLFGFEEDCFPTEGGLRHWLTALGQHSQNGDTVSVALDEKQATAIAWEYLNDLIARSVTLLLESGFITPSAWEKRPSSAPTGCSTMPLPASSAAPSPRLAISPPLPTTPVPARRKRRDTGGAIATPRPAPRCAAGRLPATPKPVSSNTAAPISPGPRPRSRTTRRRPAAACSAMGMPVCRCSS